MKRLPGQLLLAAGLWAAFLSPARAGDSPTGQDAVSATFRTAPPVRLGALARNLWDLVRQTPESRVLTGKTCYDWEWLAGRYDPEGKGVIARDDFPGSDDDFARLDRNWDGRLTAEDFNWTAKGTLARQKATTFALFKAIDRSSDGQITADEWLAVFEKMARDKKYLNDRDLEELVFMPLVRKTEAERRNFAERTQTRAGRLQRMLESGKLFTDGPEPGELAPDFSLRTPDGKSTVRLSSYRGNKPVVLIFGSFT